MQTYLSAPISWHISVYIASSSISPFMSCTRFHDLLDLAQRLDIEREINATEAN